MSAIKAYTILNIKMLIKDRLSFIWSIAFPSVYLLINRNSISDYMNLRFWWTYIIVTSYLFGVGLHALQQKEEGNLKTFFSIRKSRVAFFFACLITQITYSLLCLSIFNMFSVILLKISFQNWISITLLSTLLIVLAIPVAFASYNFTLFNHVHFSSIHTIVTIIVFMLFIMMPVDSSFNKWNPLIIISNLVILSAESLFYYAVAAVIIIGISLYSIYNYSVCYDERR